MSTGVGTGSVGSAEPWPPVPKTTYEWYFLSAARAAGMSSVDVAELGYEQIAAMSSVTLGSKGESPADFFYVQVRRYVWHVLATEERKAIETNMRDGVLAKLSDPEQLWLRDVLAMTDTAEGMR